ncbi:MAG: carbamoyltransferase C-terminal domain-containing protein [Myxococcota bacterium]
MDLLGLSTGDTGAAAALVRDGRVVAAAAEERFTRQRLDPNYPRFAADFCLGGRPAAELDGVAVCGDPADRFTRVLVGSLGAGFPRGAPAFVRNMKAWVGHRLWTRDEVSRRLDVHPASITFVPRHRCLAAQAWQASGWEDAATLVVDDVGEWACSAVFGPRLEERETVPYPHSLGLVTAAIAALVGLRPWEGRPALWDLAAWGRPIFAGRMRRVLQVREDGTYRVDPSLFRFAELFEAPHGTPWAPGLLDLFGSPRDPRRPFLFGADVAAADPEDQRAADVAASLQVVVEEVVLALARRVATATGATRLCLSGSMAQNASLVARLRRDGPFEGVFVPPEPSFGATGAALWVHAQRGGAPAGEAAPFVGRAYDAGRDLRALAHLDPVYWQRFRRRGCRPVRDARLDVRQGLAVDALAALVAGDLADGRVAGWVEGRFEHGAHALGSRSVLAAPADPEVARRLRERVTGLASWRPLALAVAEEDVARVVAEPLADWWTAVPVPVREDVREALRGGVHVDGTVRVLAVSAVRHPRLHALLRAWGARTGLAALLHAGLQEEEEPLAGSPADALIVFMRTELDTLVLGDAVVRKEYP